jgi:NADP-dependent 3-hydroxy acid dehydrogenase YdfG
LGKGKNTSVNVKKTRPPSSRVDLNELEDLMEDLAIYPRLKGKNVIITGASAGIGEASAIHFAACGSNLLLLARRVERLEKLKKELSSKYKVIVHVVKVDVSDKQDWENFSKNIPEPFKSSPDILLNNAGKALGMKKLFEYDWTDVNDMIEVNVKGVILVTQTFVPIMKARGSGHIVNLSSIAGKQAYVNGSIYCATKFAVEALSDSLRQELVDTPIRVTKISPGLVNTEFSTVRFAGNKTAADKVYEGLTPLVAEDIADQILYVCSRPAHVQIADILVFPTSQASATVVHRNTSKL